MHAVRHQFGTLLASIPRGMRVFVCRQGDQGDAQAQMWQQAFYKLAAAAGVPADPRQGQPPEAIIEQAQAARHRDPWVQVSGYISEQCHFEASGSAVPHPGGWTLPSQGQKQGGWAWIALSRPCVLSCIAKTSLQHELEQACAGPACMWAREKIWPADSYSGVQSDMQCCLPPHACPRPRHVMQPCRCRRLC